MIECIQIISIFSKHLLSYNYIYLELVIYLVIYIFLYYLNNSLVV